MLHEPLLVGHKNAHYNITRATLPRYGITKQSHTSTHTMNKLNYSCTMNNCKRNVNQWLDSTMILQFQTHTFSAHFLILAHFQVENPVINSHARTHARTHSTSTPLTWFSRSLRSIRDPARVPPCSSLVEPWSPVICRTRHKQQT